MRDLLGHGHDVRERVSARLAAFGGVYANLPALAATLDDIAPRGIAQVWCLGDVGGFGPDPERCVSLLRERAVPTVQGNYDHALGHRLGDCACGYSDPDDQRFAQLSFDYTDVHVNEESRAWLASLPTEARFTLGGRRVLLCHGSPRRQNEFLWDSGCSDAFLERLCDEQQTDLLVCSHTGLHWRRHLAGGRCVVNAGAIGRPAHDGVPGATYAEIEVADGAIKVRFRHVRYDHEALALRMEDAGLPAEFAETVRTGWWTTCFGSLPVRERLAARDARTAHR